jgi:hypothetical protein
VAYVGGFTIGDEPTEGTDWTLVCDPISGRLLHVEPSLSGRDHYCGNDSAVTRAAKLGSWLALENLSLQSGSACGGPSPTYNTTIVNTDTGLQRTAAGGISGPGAPAPTFIPEYGTPTELGTDSAGTWPAVVLTNGAMAWAEASQDSFDIHHPLMLADATGVRSVGTATTPSLRITGPDLEWTEQGTPRTQNISREPSWTVAVTKVAKPLPRAHQLTEMVRSPGRRTTRSAGTCGRFRHSDWRDRAGWRYSFHGVVETEHG